jgi:predicted O-methyltransferase YrrM
MSGLAILWALRRNGGGRFVTMEGSRAQAEIATAMYRAQGFDEFEVVVGDFDRTLAPLLARIGPISLAFIDGNHREEPTLRYDSLVREHAAKNASVVHDDIRWSSEMIASWQAVTRRPAARVFDAFRMGIVEMGGTPTNEIMPVWLGISQFA